MIMMRLMDIPPVIILLAFLAVIAALLLIRRRLLVNSPAEAEPAHSVQELPIGNGQTIGARNEQDDYFASAETPQGVIAVLADGISGLSNGRMASTVAVTTFMRQFMNVSAEKEIVPFISKAAKLANSEILRQLGGASGGTTLVVAVMRGLKLYWGAVGDSILLIYRNGDFIPVNQKHTYATLLEERYLSGEISKEEALANPQRKQLINYLGYEGYQEMEIGEKPFELRQGDKVLLCSDGLYNTLSEVEMEEALKKSQTPHDAAEYMIEAIEKKRLVNQDNATVIVLEVW
ncbi:PP2C family protein-serine/threonine phosphatase [Paenibacillus algorifonticola]|uniref:PP2C family protein-serine/threonine phosphatase n=1 Tax=Paenibacillus algorifonticola TaxID=684063 RepID=UPI003D28F82B